MNYYSLLGVDKKATPEEIKKAFRKKAKKAHPDKGGDADTMAHLNKAYECLSDEEKRAYYDATGTEQSLNGIDQQAMSIIYGILLQLSDMVGDDFNMVEAVVEQIKTNIMTMRASRPDLERRILKSERQRKRIRRKTEGVNRLDFIFQQKIDAMKEKLAQLPEGIRIGERALEIMRDYEGFSDVRRYDGGGLAGILGKTYGP